MNILKIRDFFGSGIVNNLRITYQIDILEVLLQNGLDFLRSFTLNDELVLIGDKFGDYAYYFAYFLVILFFSIHHYVYKNIYYELYRRESFLLKVFLNSFNHRPFSLDGLLISLLAKFVHNIELPSWIVY